MKQERQTSSIHDLGPRDFATMLLLNNEHAKETSWLDEERLAALIGLALCARGIDRGATAFLIALDHNAPYKNPNFEWFRATRDSFVYIDRVIVAESARGQGVARLLYQDLFAAARRLGHNRVVCEINLEPPNPSSIAFHAAMGFVAIGQATIHGGTKTVRYLERALR